SHVVPDKQGDKYSEFMNRRHTAQSTTVDEFVVADSGRIYGILERYKTLLLDKYPHTYVTRYEEMTSNFQGWLKELLDHCQLTITSELFQSLLQENDGLRPKEENVRRHLRKGKAGDYKEKLKTETIKCLNAKFSSLLDTFGYQR